MNAFGLIGIVDGINEKGLAGGVPYVPGYAQYADPASVSADKALALWDLLTWALTRFVSVAEVKAARSQVSVIDLSKLRYYVKSYDDQTLRLVDLKGFDRDANEISSSACMKQGPRRGAQQTRRAYERGNAKAS